jgi:hypothetical protein
MSTMITEVYEAFISADTPEDKARVGRNNQRALRRMFSSAHGMVQCATLIAPNGPVDQSQRARINVSS